MLAGLIVTMLAVAGLDVLFPVVSAYLIDTVAGAGDKPDEAAIEAAFLAVLFLVAQGLGYNLARFAAFRIWLRFATHCMYAIVSEAFARVQRYSADWHSDNFAGATVRKITRGMWAYDLFADTVYVGLFPTAAVLIGVTALLTWQWPLIGLTVTVISALYIAVTALLAKHYVAPVNRAHNEADSAIGAALADAVTCDSAVKAFGAEAREDARLSHVLLSWKERALRAWLRMENLNIIQVLILNVMKFALFALVIWFWIEGKADVGGVTFVLTSYLLISGYLRDVGQHLQHLQKAINELDDVVAFSRLPVGVPVEKQADPVGPMRNDILDRCIVVILDHGKTRIDAGNQRVKLCILLECDVQQISFLAVVDHIEFLRLFQIHDMTVLERMPEYKLHGNFARLGDDTDFGDVFRVLGSLKRRRQCSDSDVTTRLVANSVRFGPIGINAGMPTSGIRNLKSVITDHCDTCGPFGPFVLIRI